jgi:hypothetical protein
MFGKWIGAFEENVTLAEKSRLGFRATVWVSPDAECLKAQKFTGDRLKHWRTFLQFYACYVSTIRKTID